MDALAGSDPVRIGAYRLVGRLGVGGMGRVYLAELPSGRKVAVKVVHPHLVEQDETFRGRFRHEVDAAKAVGGFWTAAVVDSDADAEKPWFATEYIPAPPLSDAIGRGGVLDVPALRRLGLGLAEALAAIHRCGLVHRDLKPSNVLMADGGPRVIDFGIARALEGSSPFTTTGAAIGTVGYLAPEQATGAGVSAATDVFALGAVLTFAAAGQGPFGAGRTEALLYRTVHADPDLDDVPEALRALLLRCLAKSPSDRPSVEEVIAELDGGDAGTGPPDVDPSAAAVGPAAGTRTDRPPPEPTRTDSTAPPSSTALPNGTAPPDGGVTGTTGSRPSRAPVTAARPATAPPSGRPSPVGDRPTEIPAGASPATRVPAAAPDPPVTSTATPGPPTSPDPTAPGRPTSPDPTDTGRPTPPDPTAERAGRRRYLVAGALVVVALVVAGALVWGTGGPSGTGAPPVATPGPTTPTDRPVTTVALTSGAADLAVSPDGSRVAVVNKRDDTVSVVDTGTGRVLSTVPAPTPEQPAFTPDGRSVWIAAYQSETVIVLDGRTGVQTGTVTDCCFTDGVTFSRDGSRAYLMHGSFTTISVVDVGRRAVVASIPAGNAPWRLALVPARNRGYLTYRQSDSDPLGVLDTTTNALTARIPLPGGIVDVAASPDGGRVYLGGGNGTVVVVDTATDTVVGTVPVGSGEVSVVPAPDGRTLYAADDTGVVGIDTATSTVTRRIGRTDRPYDMGISPDGATLFVTSFEAGRLTLLRTAT